ncbi:MAG: complex I subunit 5 family protein [Nocardioidaceae bacterium]
MNDAAHVVVPLLVVGPSLGAALIAASGLWLPRLVADVAGLVVAVASTVGAAWVCVTVGGGRVVVWFGDWLPVHGQSVGVAIVADRAAATLVFLAGALTVAALVYSWRYLADVSASYQSLLLVFLAAMSGFAMSGDLFNAFVWFELMGVVAYALTGMRVEEPRSVQGALTFGIINSLGASCALVGVALLYARTGELNFAAVGQVLRAHRPDGLVAVACALVIGGLLVKAAAVPFHFWTADAEAVAPAPVCALLSGIMVVLGVYGVARLWWVVFDHVISATAMRDTLLVVGAVTALVGGTLCLGQRHIKRLLAYSTVSHVGVLVLAVALLGDDGLVAAGLYALGHACAKGALFLGTGVLLNERETVDEHVLFGQGRDMPFAATIFVVGGLGLAGLPILGTWVGKAILDDAAVKANLWWVPVVVTASAVMTGGAVLRVALRVFFGAGPRPADAGKNRRAHEEAPETETRLSSAPWSMLAPALVLLAASVALSVVPGVRAGAADAAAAFTDGAAYTSAVLHPSAPTHPAAGVTPPAWTLSGVGLGLVSALLAVGVACLGVWGSRLPATLRRCGAAVRPPIDVLHTIHSGHIGDYVAWCMVGMAALGAALLW